MNPPDLTEEQRGDLVERLAREIHLRGMTGLAVHFLEASRPDRPLGSSAMLFFDPVLRTLFGAETSLAAILVDEEGIDDLIDRLEELDEQAGWDA